MFTEDDLMPLSGLHHMAFCERQWALIHIERQWEENSRTAEGRVLHEHVHEAGSESRKTLVVVRGLVVCATDVSSRGGSAIKCLKPL